MGMSKLIKYINSVLDADKRAQYEEKQALKKALKKLKVKQKSLEEKLETENDEHERKRLLEKIEVARAQRKKGLSLLGQLIEK